MVRKVFLVLLAFLINITSFLPIALADSTTTTSSSKLPSFGKVSTTLPQQEDKGEGYSAQGDYTRVDLSIKKPYVKQGETFEVLVEVDLDVNEYLYGGSVDILFDNTVVQAESAKPGDMFTNLTYVDDLPDSGDLDPSYEGVYFHNIDNNLGEISYGSTLIGDKPGVTTPEYAKGQFAIITFKALQTAEVGSVFSLTATNNDTLFDGINNNALIKLSDPDAQGIGFYSISYNARTTITDATVKGAVFELSTVYPLLEGATIEIYDSTRTNLIASTTTNSDGEYVIKNSIPTGNYRFVVSKSGYLTYESELFIDGDSVNPLYFQLPPKGDYNIMLEWDASGQKNLDLIVEVFNKDTNSMIGSYYLGDYNSRGDRNTDPYVEMLNSDSGMDNPIGQENAVINTGNQNYRYEIMVNSNNLENKASSGKLYILDNINNQVHEIPVSGDPDVYNWDVTEFTLNADGSLHFEPVVHDIVPERVTEGDVTFTITGQSFDSVSQVHIDLYKWNTSNNYVMASADELSVNKNGWSGAGGNKGEQSSSSSEQFNASGAAGGTSDHYLIPVTIISKTNNEIVVSAGNLTAGNYDVNIRFDDDRYGTHRLLNVRPTQPYLDQQYYNWGPMVFEKDYQYLRSVQLDIFNLTTTSETPIFRIDLKPMGTDQIAHTINIDSSDVTPGSVQGNYHLDFDFPIGITQGNYNAELVASVGTENITFDMPPVVVGNPFIWSLYPRTLPASVENVKMEFHTTNILPTDVGNVNIYSVGGTEPITTAALVIEQTGPYQPPSAYANLDFTNVLAGNYEVGFTVDGKSSLRLPIVVTNSPVLVEENSGPAQHVYKAGITSFKTFIEGYNLAGKSYTAELVNEMTGETIATANQVALVNDTAKFETGSALEAQFNNITAVPVGHYYVNVKTTDGSAILSAHGDGTFNGKWIRFTDQTELFEMIPYEVVAGTTNQVRINGVNLGTAPWTIDVLNSYNFSIVQSVGNVTPQVDLNNQEYLEFTLPGLTAGSYYLKFSNATSNFSMQRPITVVPDGSNLPVANTVSIIDGPSVLTIPTTGTTNATYHAEVYDQHNNPMSEDVIWSVQTSDPAISVGYVSGEVIISPDVTVTQFTLRATAKTNFDVYDEFIVNLVPEGTVTPYPSKIEISGSSSLTIPSETTGTTTSTYHATVLDQYNNSIAEPVLWSVLPTDSGISVDPHSGIVTITSEASSGQFHLKATLQSDTNIYTEWIIYLVPEGGSETPVPYSVSIVGPASIKELAAGETPSTAQYTATVYDQFGQTMTDQNVTWSLGTTDTSISIDSNGLVTVPNGVTVNEFEVIATTSNQVNGYLTVYIEKTQPNDSVPYSVEVYGPTSLLIPTTEQGYTAVIKDQYGNYMQNVPLIWSVSPSDVGVTVDSNGKVSVSDTTTATSVILTAETENNIVGSMPVSLIQDNEYTPEPTTVSISGEDVLKIPVTGAKDSLPYHAVVLDQKGVAMKGEQITWSVSPAEAGVRVFADGVVNVESTATLTSFDLIATVASTTGVSASKTISLVKDTYIPIVSTVTISNPVTQLDVPATGTTTHQFDVVVKDQYENTMENAGLTWMVSPAGSGVTVDNSGLVTVDSTTTLGSFTLTAKAPNGVEHMTTVTLVGNQPVPVVDTIQISGPSSIMLPVSGDITEGYTATVYDQNGSSMASESVTWELVSNVEGVTVDSITGLVTVKNTAAEGTFGLRAISNTNSAVSTVKSITLYRVDQNAIVPGITFDLLSYGRGDTITLQLKLNNVQENQFTNGAEFFIGYDLNAVELATNNADNDIVSGYLPLTVLANNTNNGFITASYLDTVSSVQLVDKGIVLTAKFKVKETANLGTIDFTVLSETNILNVAGGAFNVNNGMPQSFTTVISDAAKVKGKVNVYLGDEGSSLNNLLLSRSTQSAVNNKFSQFIIEVMNEANQTKVEYKGVDSFERDALGNLALKGTDGRISGDYLVNVTDLGSNTLKIYGAAYLPKTIQIDSLAIGQTISLDSISLMPGDFRTDNKINVFDFQAWLSLYKKYLSGSATEEEISTADISLNGKADVFDFQVWLESYKKYLLQ